MAIQELTSSEVTGTKGGTRVIAQSATGLIMDIVQAQMYTKPIPSTVRELAANARDSQEEKKRAIAILTGQAKVSDFFVERHGEEFEDSKWQPEYYSLDHFDSDNNVELIYKSNSGVGFCDRFIVKDKGVGVGQNRLLGILSVGFSTKRNRTDLSGSYGLGAKASLSTGCDYYTMTSVHNGLKYSVKIFTQSINSLIGAFDLETGEENSYIEMADGYRIYGEKTTETNGCTIEVPCKKHHKDEYIKAVSTQLMYFDNLTLTEIDEYGNRKNIEVKAKVLYDSPNIVVSSNSPYNRPHVIVVKGSSVDSVGIAYGELDFSELELPVMYGAVGIKCPIRQVVTNEHGEEVVINDGVDVIPSRESVKWNTNTKEFILKQFEQAKEEATKIVEDMLNQTDFVDWALACGQVTYGSVSSGSALSQLKGIVDTKTLAPRFKHSKFKFRFMSPRMLLETFNVQKKVKKNGEEADTEELSWDDFKGRIYLREAGEEVPRLVRHYLLSQGSYVEISLKTEASLRTMAGKAKSLFAEEYESLVAEQEELYKLLEHRIDKLSEVEVPESYKMRAEKEENDEKIKSLTPAEIRALDGKIVLTHLTPKSYYQNGEDMFLRTTKEPTLKQVNTWKSDDSEVYWGNFADMSKAHYMAKIFNESTYTQDFKMVLVAKDNTKHFKDFSHINDLFGKYIVTGTKVKIEMHSKVIKWNTARKVHKELSNPKYLFLNGFAPFNKDMHDLFNELSQYTKHNYEDLSRMSSNLGVREHNVQFCEFLDNLERVQETLETNPESVVEVIKAINHEAIPHTTNDTLVVDREILNKLEELITYAAPICDLLSKIKALTNLEKVGDTVAFEHAIKEYLNFKGR